MRLLRIVLVVAVVLVFAAAGAYAYLTAREMPPEMSEYSFDLTEVRRLAGSLEGAAPVAVHSELVATAHLPRGGLFAGESLSEPHEMVHQSYQVLYPDGSFLILDAGFDAEMHAAMDGGEHRAEGYAAVQDALPRASQILITHEHADHLQGIARYPRPAALQRNLRLSAEQLANTERLDAVDFPAELREVAPISYDHYAAIAPGAVLVKAAGHTPGSQLLYVGLADGRELLFIGDVAWHMDMIRKLHYRPRLVTRFFLGEDRAAVLDQFRRLHDLDLERPEVRIVVSHDRQQRQALLDEGLIVDGFR